MRVLFQNLKIIKIPLDIMGKKGSASQRQYHAVRNAKHKLQQLYAQYEIAPSTEIAHSIDAWTEELKEREWLKANWNVDLAYGAEVELSGREEVNAAGEMGLLDGEKVERERR